MPKNRPRPTPSSIFAAVLAGRPPRDVTRRAQNTNIGQSLHLRVPLRSLTIRVKTRLMPSLVRRYPTSRTPDPFSRKILLDQRGMEATCHLFPRTDALIFTRVPRCHIPSLTNAQFFPMSLTMEVNVYLSQPYIGQGRNKTNSKSQRIPSQRTSRRQLTSSPSAKVPSRRTRNLLGLHLSLFR